MSGENVRSQMMDMAPRWQPRGMAIICLASGVLNTTVHFFPLPEVQQTLGGLRDIGILFGSGLAYWTLARYFRVWMVHAVVIAGLLWGLLSLAEAEGQITAALLLVTLLWTGIFVGASFSPSVSRIYEGMLCLGIAIGLVANGVQGGITLGIAFGLSFIVTMELLSWSTSLLRSQASTDPVTGLLNRHGLEQAVKRVRDFDRNSRVAVLLADLDGFKEVNDRRGHRVGDRLLRDFAEAWTVAAGSGSLISRTGGDEFVAVFPVESEEEARKTVDRLRRSSPIPWSGGLAFAEEGESFSACMERADHLMYREKKAKGRAGIRRTSRRAPAGEPG